MPLLAQECKSQFWKRCKEAAKKAGFPAPDECHCELAAECVWCNKAQKVLDRLRKRLTGDLPITIKASPIEMEFKFPV